MTRETVELLLVVLLGPGSGATLDQEEEEVIGGAKEREHRMTEKRSAELTVGVGVDRTWAA